MALGAVRLLVALTSDVVEFEVALCFHIVLDEAALRTLPVHDRAFGLHISISVEAAL